MMRCRFSRLSGGLLEQGLDVGRNRGLAVIARRAGAGRNPGKARKPFLEVVIEPVLREPSLQIQKAQDERSRETEKRGAERGAHAAKRSLQSLLQQIERG